MLLVGIVGWIEAVSFPEGLQPGPENRPLKTEISNFPQSTFYLWGQLAKKYAPENFNAVYVSPIVSGRLHSDAQLLGDVAAGPGISWPPDFA